MISYRWDPGASVRPELSALVAEAADHDAEQGFGALEPLSTTPGGGARELVAWIRRPVGGGRRRTWAAAAYLRVTPGVDDLDTAALVVHPRFRSLGVATALVERLGAPEGEASGVRLGPVRTWAHGTHPAAERMANRFGLVPDQVVTELIVPIASSRPLWSPSGPVDVARATSAEVDAFAASFADLSAPLLGGDRICLAAKGEHGETIGMATARSGGREPREATIEFLAVRESARRQGVGRALLEALLLTLADWGTRTARLLVGEKDVYVPVLRSLGFRHDQTDLRFTLDGGPLVARRVSAGSVR